MALLDGRRFSRPKALVRRLRNPARNLARKSHPVRPWNSAFAWLNASQPVRWTFLFFLCTAYAVSAVPALGQTDVNDVHVASREVQPHDEKATAIETKIEGAKIGEAKIEEGKTGEGKTGEAKTEEIAK